MANESWGAKVYPFTPNSEVEMKKYIRSVLTMTVATVATAFAAGALGYGYNNQHELMVYSIEDYGNVVNPLTDESRDWKADIYLDPNQDPYDDFWTSMYTSCSGDDCACLGSVKRKNSGVSVYNMVNDDNGIRDADMVFFFGHNTMISPQWYHDGNFEYWVPYYLDPSVYAPIENIGENWPLWGTDYSSLFYYYYHRQTITNASLSNPYAVFYGYWPFTSVLIGKDFRDGTWEYENSYNQTTAFTSSGNLGAETEWFIAHGCNAVTVAKYDDLDPPSENIVSTSLGVNAWKKSWGDTHLVMGHYYSTYTTMEPSLAPFAADLKSGGYIKEAYFDVHTSGDPDNPALAMPSAIALASSQDCVDYLWTTICFPATSYFYMMADTWTDPLPGPVSDDVYHYTTSWKVYEE